MAFVYVKENTERMMKVIIAGSRDYKNVSAFSSAMKELLQTDVTEVISGCCLSGPDQWGEHTANAFGIKIKRFPAEWNKYGKKAGPMRNKQMSLYGDILYAFWDGTSTGTKNMIECMHKLRKPYKIFLF